MTIRLQQTGYRESRYERPNQTWVCGWAADGRPCKLGPDRKGRCPALAEAHCAPRRDGDRYLCTRPEAFGGPCERGPLPDGSCCGPEPEHAVCQPRLSIRARRGRLNVAVFIGAIGALLVLFAGPWRLEVISPGELTSVHMAIETPPDAANSCAVCHAAAEHGPLEWISGGIGDHGSMAESGNCLRCHFADDAARAHAFDVHSVPNDVLGAGGGPVACATCHREHRGRDHDLAFMNDTQCQVCHQAQFKSFSAGHPEFRSDQRHGMGIAFDHASHQEHFGETPFACLRCHEPDTAKRLMVLRPFEASCVGCHYGGSTDHHGDQIAKMGAGLVIQLPGAEFESDDVDWPEDLDFEVELPPLMRLLLAGDDEAVAPLIELEDAEIVDELDDQDKVAITSAIKRLVDELLHGDLRPRIARALGVSATHPTPAALADELSWATRAVLEFQQHWLPEPGVEPIERDASPRPETGWYHDQDDVAISYGVATHADRFVKVWVDALMVPREAGTGDRDTIRQWVAEELADSFATCLRCHAGGRWKPANREIPALGDHKPFVHGPHLSVFGSAADSCTACHRLAEPSAGASACPSRHGFLEYARSDCASCHRPGRAADSCLTCHRYHILRP